MARPSFSCILTTLLVCVGASACVAADAPDRQWILVTAPAYREALEPLCKQRENQGFRVEVVRTTDILEKKQIVAGEADKLRARVRELCKNFRGTSYILLVGAVEAGTLEEPEQKVLPCLRGTTGRMKGQPSDNGYGCLNDELLPTVAIGRFPARTVAEAEGMVKKTIRFENDEQPGEWRRRLTILAGVPAFNPVVDRMVENVAMSRFGKIDPVWTGEAIYHSAGSRFTLPDDQLHDRALKYVESGQAFTLYLGHSWPKGLYAPDTKFLDRDDFAKLKIGRGQGIFGTFGCNGCQLSGDKGEGYGLYAIRNPDGPVAVTGSHGVCFSAMVQLAAEGLLQSFSGPLPDRLGKLCLGVKQGIASGKIDDGVFDLLDEVDGDPKIAQATQRLEHLEMFLLLGDPALKLPGMKTDLKLRAEDARPGGQMHVELALPDRLVNAEVHLVVERPINSEPNDLEPVPEKPAEARARALVANHDRANRFALVKKDVTASGKTVEMELDLPAKLPWKKLIVRAYAVKDHEEGVGVATVEVKKP